MNGSTFGKLATSGLMLSLLTIGCKPAGGARPVALGEMPAVREGQAAKLAANARRAIVRGQMGEAIASLEMAVSLEPRDPVWRGQLAQAYLVSGRLVSAQATFDDVLTLDPANRRALMSRALARIALGHGERAAQDLDAARGLVDETDRGFGLALAGQPARAIEILEALAREPGASAKTRQNLAFSYMLAGRWQEAQATAAQDLDPAELQGRMLQWAQLAQPRHSWDQVAALLGIKPILDPGQPAVLALAPLPDGQQSAAAEAPPTMLAAAPEPAPAAAAVVEPAPEPAPAAVAVAEVPAAVASPAPFEVDRVPRYVEPASMLATIERGPVKTSRAPRHAKPAAQGPVLAARRSVAATPRRAAFSVPNGRFVVQLGAFASPAAVETAWGHAKRRAPALAAYAPARSVYRTATAWHRLSIGGFAARDEAQRLCGRIKASGLPCFVRERFGESPMQMAAAAPTRGLRPAA